MMTKPTSMVRKVYHEQVVRTLKEECDTLQKALDRVIEDRDAVWGDIRDEYAQAALTGLMGARDEHGRTPLKEWTYQQIVDAAFELADLAMERRKKR